MGAQSVSMERISRHPGTGPANDAMAAAIKGLRVERGFRSQQALADASGIPLGSVVRVEAGSRAINVEQIASIARACRVSMTSIVHRAEDLMRGVTAPEVDSESLPDFATETPAEWDGIDRRVDHVGRAIIGDMARTTTDSTATIGERSGTDPDQ